MVSVLCSTTCAVGRGGAEVEAVGAGVAHLDKWVSLEAAGRVLGVAAAATGVDDEEGPFDASTELVGAAAACAAFDREAISATLEGPTNEERCWVLTGCTRLGGIDGSGMVP